MKTIEGKIEAIIYQDPESWYTVCVVSETTSETPSVLFSVSEEEYKCAGVLPGATQGVSVKLQVEANHHPRYGLQYKVINFQYPHLQEGGNLTEFLASGIVKGVGTVLAVRICDHFGDRVRDVLDNNPERLAEVNGIGDKSWKRIAQSWRDVADIEKLANYLVGGGLEVKDAVKAHRVIGRYALQTVIANPYVLMHAVSFVKADDFALAKGVSPSDERRIRAGLEYVLKKETFATGSTYTGEQELIRGALRLLATADGALDCERVSQVVREAVSDGHLASEDVDGELIIFPQETYEAEVFIAKFIKKALANETKTTKYKLGDVEEMLGFELAKQQREGLSMATSLPVCIITGGPGTGKTTMTKAVVHVLKEESPLLLAPTGKAAQRMEEATGYPASTIHRALGYGGEGFVYNKDNKLPNKTIIIDEASMVDVQLMHDLLVAVRDEARLILVGDPDQLPSVGPGSVLSDCIESGVIPVIQLDVVQRQSESSSIITNAHAINAGRMPSFDGDLEGQTYFCQTGDNAQEIKRAVIQYMTNNIQEAFGYDLDDIAVLCPMRKGDAGVTEMNKAIRERVNPRQPGKPELGRFRLGDRVMVTRNDYHNGVYNGDVGKVVKINTDLGEVTVHFEIGDRLVNFYISEMSDVEYAWATTIHKAQGSEYPCVILVMSMMYGWMLQRRLLYTGHTRAKQTILYIGSGRAIARATKVYEELKRNTSLKRRLT